MRPLFIILVISFLTLVGQAQNLTADNRSDSSVALSGGCGGMVLLFPANSWACPNSDTAFFITSAWNYNRVKWEKSLDNGITWTDASPLKNTLRDTLFVNVNDSLVTSYLFRAVWYGSPCPIVYTTSASIISYRTNTSIWTGYGMDEYWNNPKNWLCEKVPDLNTDVIIKTAGVINVTSDIEIKSLQFSGDGLLKASTGVNISILN